MSAASSLSMRIPVSVIRPPAVREEARTARDQAVDLAAMHIVAGVFAVAMGYGLLRYVVAGTVPVSQIALFILNKGAAVAGAILVAMSLGLSPIYRWRPAFARQWGGLRKKLGLAGFGFAAAHSLMTFALMGPAYYGKLYDGAGKFTWIGSIVVLAGILGLAALVLPAATSFSGIKNGMKPAAWKSMQRWAVVSLALTALHVVSLGFKTWLAPATWPAHLPPLTILAIVPIAACFAVRALGALRRR